MERGFAKNLTIEYSVKNREGADEKKGWREGMPGKGMAQKHRPWAHLETLKSENYLEFPLCEEECGCTLRWDETQGTLDSVEGML